MLTVVLCFNRICLLLLTPLTEFFPSIRPHHRFFFLTIFYLFLSLNKVQQTLPLIEELLFPHPLFEGAILLSISLLGNLPLKLMLVGEALGRPCKQLGLVNPLLKGPFLHELDSELGIGLVLLS